LGKIIGGPYQFKPDSNPGVGAYDLESFKKFTMPSSPNAKIMKPTNKELSPCRSLPVNQAGPDAYDGHIKPFG
jgi:hypothetical protein